MAYPSIFDGLDSLKYNTGNRASTIWEGIRVLRMVVVRDNKSSWKEK